MILLIDNYDSFSYNLYQLIGTLDPSVRVVRTDAVSLEELEQLQPDGIVLSPGPGRPEDAGICLDVVCAFYDSIPLLGVCLGHQALCMAFGAEITYAQHLMHGKQSLAQLAEDPLFAGCPNPLPVARYHSLAADPASMPACLDVLATTGEEEGAKEIMAVRHHDHPAYGLQFHPESIMTPDGAAIMKNFLAITGR